MVLAEVFRRRFEGLGLTHLSGESDITIDMAGFSLAERVSRAVKAIPLDKTETRMLEVLMANPGTDARGLSTLCGWGGTIWHTHFARLCQRRIDYLGVGYAADPDTPCFLHGLLTNYDATTGCFTMKPEVEGRLRELGLGHP